MAPFSRQKEQELFRRWREHGDRKAYNLLIMSQQSIVTFVAYQFRARGVEMEDCLQAGWMGVARAILSFDPSLGFRLSTYATNWVKSYVSDVANNGRKHAALVTSLEHEVGQDLDTPITLGDMLTSPELDPRLDTDHILTKVNIDAWSRVLNRRERYIIARRYFGEQTPTLSEVGRELNLSRERIRQLETRALNKIRHYLQEKEDHASQH